MFTAVHQMPIHLAPKAVARSYRSRVVVQQATCTWTKRKTGVATG